MANEIAGLTHDTSLSLRDVPSGIEKPRIEDSSSVRRPFTTKTVIVCGPDCMQPHTRRFSAQNVSSIKRTCENKDKPIIPFPSAVAIGDYGSPPLLTGTRSYPSFWFGDTDGRVRQSCCRPVRHEMMWPKISANDGNSKRLLCAADGLWCSETPVTR